MIETKKRLYSGLATLCDAGATGFERHAADLYDPQVEVRAAHPVNEGKGLEFLADALYGPALAAFPDLERRDLIVVGGSYEGRRYVATMGHYCGTFHGDWLGIPATGRATYIRYGEVHEVRDGRIVQTNCLWDILDVIRQAGHWPLAPSLGAEGMWPGPITQDGVVLTPQDPAQSRASLAQTLAMQATLGAYGDEAEGGREGLLNMPQKDHWHPKMMWYGPSGIGTARGLSGFVDHHQLPFRTAFPGRKGGGQWDEVAELKEKHGGGHYVRVGDGPYSVTAGWPSVFAMHTGPDFLGIGPTNRPVTMRVMDFYLHHEGLIRENWVPLDILDLLLQMGVDVLGRMRALLATRG
ncbi:ester cyclase [Psychromarinibacter sp. C21-152]|uniref:Ester cyclase n=1 Tax=Psychromarinibacter sediminicola TaxID=3033385 RepID=A0AAE3T6C4_9RHOB|nr:ester cyclase [Psychromarinibacter sediminicola]MDF0599105.1 ester cyclase [Psychromarinibacter sediminicola]